VMYYGCPVLLSDVLLRSEHGLVTMATEHYLPNVVRRASATHPSLARSSEPLSFSPSV
jgi:hypothetical protein